MTNVTLCCFACRHQHQSDVPGECWETPCVADCRECAKPYRIYVRLKRDGRIVVERTDTMKSLLQLAVAFIITGNIVLFYSHTIPGSIETYSTLGEK